VALIVQKFGGTSVGDPERIKRVARRVAATAAAGNSVAVVVSAMGQTTDELVDLAKAVSDDPNPRELDMLLTAGEQISIALLSMALWDLGHPAISFTGPQAGVVTDTTHGKARIVEMRADRVREALDAGRIAIVAGFQGVSSALDVTTLGRGGSDTTAVALARMRALRDLCRELEQLVGRIAHRRENDADLPSVRGRRGHAAGHAADPLRPGDGCAAVLLDDECHAETLARVATDCGGDDRIPGELPVVVPPQLADRYAESRRSKNERYRVSATRRSSVETSSPLAHWDSRRSRSSENVAASRCMRSATSASACSTDRWGSSTKLAWISCQRLVNRSL
jgi:hypothetical protein